MTICRYNVLQIMWYNTAVLQHMICCHGRQDCSSGRAVLAADCVRVLDIRGITMSTGQIVVKDFMQLIYLELRSIIEWAKKVPGWCNLYFLWVVTMHLCCRPFVHR